MAIKVEKLTLAASEVERLLLELAGKKPDQPLPAEEFHAAIVAGVRVLGSPGREDALQRLRDTVQSEAPPLQQTH
ncbi:hypothetical protein [Solimonas sp. SE-A11]|uniref:hypothetical protein n=1 Tax=Solimonas sp. SE-A11 TaxID=3054954 RepID=UPI00259CB818|nr:hypothetical protein [Solimonas sp. SE-A11]MDM4770877.1 hypothetical protein [Solimonas sp. SE-A11]